MSNLFSALAVPVLLVITSSIAFSQSLDVPLAQIKHDGLSLTVAPEKTSRGLVIECRLKNVSDAPISWEDTGSAMGFEFKLNDKQGNEIPPDESWATQNTRNKFGFGKHALKQILPGEELFFRLLLSDAYGQQADSQTSIKIEWNPGDDSFGNPLITGRGLVINSVVSSLEAHAEKLQPYNNVQMISSLPGVEKTAPVPRKELVTKPVISPPSGEPFSLMLWSIVVVLIVAATGLLWLLLKRRS